MTTRITLRFDFDETRRLGPGKVSLLEAIQRHGSIAGAGRDFGMSYRRAWLLVDELNRMFRRRSWRHMAADVMEAARY